MSENLALRLRQDQDALELSTKIVNACAEAKGLNITVLGTSELSDLFNYFIIVSGRSDRQVQGIANKVLQTLEQHGFRPLALEGLDAAHWVVLDFGDVVLHIFYEPVRNHYDLEGLWSKAKPLRIVKSRRGHALALRAS